jgi:hypothetical protein
VSKAIRWGDTTASQPGSLKGDDMSVSSYSIDACGVSGVCAKVNDICTTDMML